MNIFGNMFRNFTLSKTTILMAAADDTRHDLRRIIGDVLRAHARARKDGLIDQDTTFESSVDVVERLMNTMCGEIVEAHEILGKCKIRPKPKAIVKIDGSLLKRVRLGKGKKSLAIPFLPRHIDYDKCCGNILHTDGLYTPCLTRVTKNNNTCKPCIGRIEKNLVNGTLEERLELRRERQHFIGRADFGTEISYEDYLQMMHYPGNIDDINNELKAQGVPLVIPKSPKWLMEIIEEPPVPPPLPGEMAEYDMINDRDMLYCDSRRNLFIKKNGEYIKVGKDDKTGIDVVPGMQKYFEPDWSSGSDSSDTEEIHARLHTIDGVEYAIVPRGDGQFDIYPYDPENLVVSEPIGILSGDKDCVEFFNS